MELPPSSITREAIKPPPFPGRCVYDGYGKGLDGAPEAPRTECKAAGDSTMRRGKRRAEGSPENKKRSSF